MTTTTKKDKAKSTGRMLPGAELNTLKQVELMRLKDGTITPEMCQHLNATEIVAALVGIKAEG